MSTPDNGTLFPLRDLPRYEELRQRAARYPQIQPSAVEAALMLFRVSTDGLLAFDTYLAHIKMTAGRMSVLTILNRDPQTPLSPSVLADRAGVTRATMTGLLDRLERDRLIKRSLDRSDRRKATVSLTAKGQTFLDGTMPGYYQRIASMMAGLSQQEQQLLTNLLYRISDRIATVTEPVPPSADGKANGVSNSRKPV